MKYHFFRISPSVKFEIEVNECHFRMVDSVQLIIHMLLFGFEALLKLGGRATLLSFLDLSLYPTKGKGSPKQVLKISVKFYRFIQKHVCNLFCTCVSTHTLFFLQISGFSLRFILN